MTRYAALAAMLFAATSAALGEAFPERWIDGTVPTEPPFQVHQHAPRTWIIRQSLSSHFEAPFIYLLAGNERALLLDTGATNDPWLRDVVDRLIGHGFPLIVAHSHAHGDHTAGDGAFSSRPATRIVGHSAARVARFFDLAKWPSSTSVVDLGDRELLLIPIPGHERSSIAIHDPLSGVLLTGDTLYPGRLYVQDFKAFRASIDRLVSTLADRTVTWVLGTHVEMTAEPGMDFGPRQPRHPNERELQLTWDHVLELQRELRSMGDTPRYSARDAFIVFPLR